MSYFTLVFGIVLIGLGLYGRFGTGTTSVTALIPAVFGLAYMTFGEGMRALPKQRRLFLLLAILLTFVAVAGSIQSALKLPAILRGEEMARENGSRISYEAVLVQATMLGLCLGYLLLALLSFFRKPAVKNQSN